MSCLVEEPQARDLEIRGSNPGPGSNFSLEESNYIRYFYAMNFPLHCYHITLKSTKLSDSLVSLGGLRRMCSPLDPWFTGSYSAEVDIFFVKTK